MNYYVTDNTGASVALNDIPEVSYAAFYEDLRVKLSDARYHAAHYFALPSATACVSSCCCSTTPSAAC